MDTFEVNVRVYGDICLCEREGVSDKFYAMIF